MYLPKDKIDGFKELHNSSGSHKQHSSYSGVKGVKPLKYSGLVGDSRTFTFMLDFFDENNINGRWDKLLDIGGAEGYHASFFKAHGLVSHAESIDVQKYEDNDAKRKSYYRKFVLNKRLERLMRREAGTGKFGQILKHNSRHFDYPLFANPLPIKQTIGNVYEISEKYDIVTAFLCLEYFNLEDILKKVSDILNEGGIFFFIVNYWWYPVNSTGIVGGVPYAVQQFSFEELVEHFSIHFPDETQYLKSSYNYFHQGRQPLVKDYVDICNTHNLKLISTKRIMPNLGNGLRTPWAPLLMQRYEKTQLSDVLKNIHRFNPDVTYEDLNTGWFMAAFEKVSQKTGAPDVRYHGKS